ncbi:MAG: helix-turn-helix transcriptional regulator [Christensenellales bacterium]|jgi:putative transcriptional regulator
MPDASIIGQKLLELRGKRPRIEVSRAVNITPSALSNYENGLRIPRDEIKISLAHFYGKTVEEIFFS